MSAIAGASISAISRGGLQCNTTRVQREASPSFSAVQPCLEGQSSFTQTSPDCQVHSPILNHGAVLRGDGSRVPILSMHGECCEESVLGDVARKGMEFAGSEGEFVSNL